MKTKPGIFPTKRDAARGFGSWLLALAVVIILGWLGLKIYGAALRIGNPFQRVAHEISNVAK